jgi:hypothetical protein
MGKVDNLELENGCRKNLEWQYIVLKAKPSRSMMAEGNIITASSRAGDMTCMS